VRGRRQRECVGALPRTGRQPLRVHPRPGCLPTPLNALATARPMAGQGSMPTPVRHGRVVAGVTARQRPCWLRRHPVGRCPGASIRRRPDDAASWRRLSSPTGRVTGCRFLPAASPCCRSGWRNPRCRSAEVRDWERDAAAREPGLTGVLAPAPARLAGGSHQPHRHLNQSQEAQVRLERSRS
jgi:hypothetical protein